MRSCTRCGFCCRRVLVFTEKERKRKEPSELFRHLFLVRTVLSFCVFPFFRTSARTRRTKGDEEKDDVLVARLKGPLGRRTAIFVFDLKDGTFADEAHDRGHRARGSSKVERCLAVLIDGIALASSSHEQVDEFDVSVSGGKVQWGVSSLCLGCCCVSVCLRVFMEGERKKRRREN